MSPYDFLGLSLFIMMFVGAFYCRRSEKKSWNNGICSECGTSWRQFDTDSQGGRMYKCQCEARHSCDVSWGVDNKKEKNV